MAPILAYPCFDCEAGEFVLHTAASAVGLGVVLEQDGHVIAYTSQSLTTSEQHYSQWQLLGCFWGFWKLVKLYSP